ncbi:hypothetical protein A2118_00830 [Candidatus Kaiserbacteria bacterium GWA2_50_9]|uniref:Uncharacterized protein n=1 Tax=Candidatus Kaiserbacteria bacterium GWA2_50_9 TaxID=1798474 RepID=A0A1F6BSJ6_9BACT|nr:MAG: hypothetical protein A2118_00830 [Candidatus Kaiserbacteria bacterium GWA2_50_9]
MCAQYFPQVTAKHFATRTHLHLLCGSILTMSEKLRSFVKNARDAGFSREERREFIEKSTKSVNARHGNYSEEQGGILASSVDPETITAFLSMLEGSRKDERDMVQLGSTLREYGTRGTNGEVLSDKEVKLVSVAVKYFESWFYDGGPIKDAPTDIHTSP